MQTFKHILSKYLLIWLTLICIVAYNWNGIASHFNISFNPFIIPNTGFQILIAVTMLAIGSLLPLEEVKMVIRRWPKILGGTTIQFLSMPLAGWLIAKAFHLEGGWFVGFILVGCVPGAMASNMLTMISKGNVSYSVGLTTCSTLLSPLLVPLLLYWFLSTTVKMDVSAMSANLLLTVVCPVIIGFTLSRIFDWWRKGAEMVGEIIANIAIILIIASVVAAKAELIEKTPAIILGALLLVNILGYICGWFGGLAIGASNKMRRALTLEIGMQNAGLGTMLATTYFKDFPQAAIVCAMYTFGCMFTGIILAQIFSRMPAKDELEELK